MTKKDILFTAGRRGASPLLYLLTEGKQYFTSEQYQELLRIAKDREEDFKSMQSRQSAKIWIDELEVK